ncbi:GNAT family N-acetyltransferase [Pseudodonghicola flavimaris]|uniref:GNAT family N-acetyltransferase n=1 Tax=Pseudodonghicola flavimaris TaxID=3050036 RepID=A0ABT7F1W4_9RHOB|nr:GNAT family N-acetyltransferase [Pseudodonghicola flavimaris]MDK3018582.1 GNAT family N-acetyltransferase [Pseudodonghicola flavimaris]
MTAALRLATEADAGALNAALMALSEELGDIHRATAEDLLRLGWGPAPAFRAVLAEASERIVGAVLYSPYVSTVKGAAGVYVSDLWTAETMRGQGLGPRLLAAALRDGGATWGARFLKLDVYHSSPDARRFYDRLGFRPARDITKMILDEAACAALKGRR